MSWRRLIAPTAFAAVAFAVYPSRTGSMVEVVRIRAHFDSVVAELNARDVGALAPARRIRRAALVARVAAYRERGEFPHNYDFPRLAVPYFTDRKTGTRCALAHLLATSGRRDIVARVTSTNNNVWVAQLSADTAFTAWLDENGITLAEAARIQVPYMQPQSNAQVARNVVFGVTAPVALAGAVSASVFNMLGNADGHSRVGNIIGMAAGFVTTGLGISLLVKPDIDSRIGTAALAMGSMSMALSTRSIHRQSSIASQREASARGVVADASLAPTVDARGAAGARVGVSIGF